MLGSWRACEQADIGTWVNLCLQAAAPCRKFVQDVSTEPKRMQCERSVAAAPQVPLQIWLMHHKIVVVITMLRAPPGADVHREQA